MSLVPVVLSDAGDGAIFAATAAVVISTLQWTLSSPWWKDSLGETVVFKDLCLLVILLPTCVSLIWPTLIGPFAGSILLLCSMLGVATVLMWRSVVMYRIKKPWPLGRRQSGTDKTHSQ